MENINAETSHEEHAVRALRAYLEDALPPMLLRYEQGDPDVGSLDAPKEWCHGEVIDVTDYPTVNIWSTSDYAREFKQTFAADGHTSEQFIDVMVDLYLVWDDPEMLYFRLLRYKAAIRKCLKASPSLGGEVMGCFITSSQNSNLFREGKNLSQACRLTVKIWTTD